jgi:alcohol dehydrogenase class IV
MMEKEEMQSTMYKVYCRSFQTVMKGANNLMGYRMPEYIEGPGSIKRLAKLVKEKGTRDVLVVTDANLLKMGLLDTMLDSFKEAGLTYTIFSDVEKNPTSDNVEEGFKVYKEKNCSSLVGFGGGAAMDCAKAIASKAVHPNMTVAQLQGLLKVHAKIPPFFAVPTTAGTGSETTVAAVIIDSKTHHKASINDPSILPKYAVLDPELTMGLPPFVTATTGLDALCHAVEAYTNHTYNTDLEDFLAKEAVRLIHDNLLTAYHDGKNLEARQNMQKAAFYAGRAFTRGCVGYVHAVGHTLGGLYGVPHGLAMSIILPHVMRQYGHAAYKRLADLADVCDIEGPTNAVKAQKFIAWIEDIKKEMEIPAGADMIKDEDVPQIITWAMAEANPLYPCPQVWEKEDFEKLIATIRSAK